MPRLINDYGLRFGIIPGRVPPEKLTATCILKATFALKHEGVAEMLPEDDQPHLTGDESWGGDPNRGLRYASDFALFKPGADLLLAAACYTPGGKPATVVETCFAVGNRRKSVVVVGDRLWHRKLIGSSFVEPIPFTRMELDWSRAFGGPDYPLNPLGRGREESLLPTGATALMAPNLEALQERVKPSTKKILPVGYSPVDPGWPQRFKKVGTYDGRYLKEDWPWFPRDFDWSYFLAAPSDQQISGDYLRGDEAIELKNLRPDTALFRSRLAGKRARCFVRVREGQQLVFKEVPLKLDTLFVDAENLQATLLWRGVTPAKTLKLKEFEEFFLVLEPLERPLAASAEGYEKLYLERKAEQDKEGLFEFEPFEPPVLPNPLAPDTAWADKLDKLVEKLKAESAALEKAPAAKMPAKPLAQAKLSPPPKTPASVAEANAQAAADWATVGAQDPRFPQKYPPPNFSPLEADLKELEAYQGLPKGAPDEEDEDWTRARVVKHREAGGHFERQDLSGLDLSGLDFSGVRFCEASLDETNLNGCTLTAADFSMASLSSVQLAEAVAREAILVEADLSGAAASKADFSRCRVEGVEFSGASLQESVFSGIEGDGASFTGADLTGARFDGAVLQGADFSLATLTNARFDGATLREADFDEVNAVGCRFEGIQGFNLRASTAMLERACFGRAQLDEAVFEDSVLVEADFRGVTARLATFTASRLDRAIVAGADFRDAKLDDVRAHGTNFADVNLFHASLENADLKGASFLDSNLYEVEFFQAKVEEARFERSNLKGTVLG